MDARCSRRRADSRMILPHDWPTMIRPARVVLALVLIAASAAASLAVDLAKAVVVVPAGLSPREKKAVEMLVDEVAKRTQIRWRSLRHGLRRERQLPWVRRRLCSPWRGSSRHCGKIRPPSQKAFA